MTRVSYESFCESADAQLTVAAALSDVIADEYSDSLQPDSAHVLQLPFCDVASWTLHHYFSRDGTTYTQPHISRHGIGSFAMNGGVGWHVLLLGLPGVGMDKVIDPTFGQFYHLVGVDPGETGESYEIGAPYATSPIAVVDIDRMGEFAQGVADAAYQIASTQTRPLDAPCGQNTHGILVGQSPEEIAGVYANIWDPDNYEPFELLPDGHRDRQTRRLANMMMKQMN